MADLSTMLKNEAQSEIEAIQKAALEQATSIVNHARDEAASLLESRKRALESNLAAGLVRAKSAANLEASALRLSAAESGMSRAFGEATARMKAFTRAAAYPNILGKLALEAKKMIGEVEAVEVNPNDIAVAQTAMVTAGITAPVRGNPNIETGVRLVGPGGRSGISNTLLGRLERVRESIAPAIAKILSE